MNSLALCSIRCEIEYLNSDWTGNRNRSRNRNRNHNRNCSWKRNWNRVIDVAKVLNKRSQFARTTCDLHFNLWIFFIFLFLFLFIFKSTTISLEMETRFWFGLLSFGRQLQLVSVTFCGRKMHKPIGQLIVNLLAKSTRIHRLTQQWHLLFAALVFCQLTSVLTLLKDSVGR